MKYLLLICTLGLTPPLFARGNGFDAGNGGDVVYCESGIPFQAQMLDIYEGKAFDETYELDLGSAELDRDQKISYYLNKLETVAKVKALRYKAEALQFFDQVKWLEGKELTDITDSNHLVLPTGCKIRQIAIRLPSGSEINGKKYLVNKDLWDLLSVDHQVSLIFHEIIYAEASFHHNNSIQARKLNRWISSSSFSEVDRNEFVKALKSWNLPIFAQNPNFPNLLFGGVTTYENGNIKEGYIAYPSQLDYKGQSIRLLPGGTRVRFFENDSSLIQRIELKHDDERNKISKTYEDGAILSLFDQDFLIEKLLTCDGQMHAVNGEM